MKEGIGKHGSGMFALKRVIAAAAMVGFMGAGTVSTVQAADGKKVFDQVCMMCHKTGVAGAPKFGDKAAWAPRVAQGMDVLYEHAIKGFKGKKGVMPPKGGRSNLSDDEVKAAVGYMVDNAK